jgi:D-alanyl-D-alanine carboxypeptidase
MERRWLHPPWILCALSLCLMGAVTQHRVSKRAIDPVTRLRRDLERSFSRPVAAQSVQWGVEILSLDRGEILYEKNPNLLFMPASNQKLLTASAALNRLGPDYRFQTRIQMDGQIEGHKLNGDLIIVSAGDPSCTAPLQSGDPRYPSH